MARPNLFTSLCLRFLPFTDSVAFNLMLPTANAISQTAQRYLNRDAPCFKLIMRQTQSISRNVAVMQRCNLKCSIHTIKWNDLRIYNSEVGIATSPYVCLFCRVPSRQIAAMHQSRHGCGTRVHRQRSLILT